MAGATQTIQRIWAKTIGSVTNVVVDPLKAFFDQINNIVADLEVVRVYDKGRAFSTAGLAIKAGSSAIVKAATAFRYITSAGFYNLSAANTDQAALVGSVTNAKFNVFVFSLTFDGTTVTQVTRMGTEGATRGAVVFPTVPHTEVLIGFVEINPTGTGPFVGGTTALDDGTVVPNAVYVNLVGAPTFGQGASLVASVLAERDVA